VPNFYFYRRIDKNDYNFYNRTDFGTVFVSVLEAKLM